MNELFLNATLPATHHGMNGAPHPWPSAHRVAQAAQANSSESVRSFQAWRAGRTLHEMLSVTEAEVRAHPDDSERRWLLVELLCVLGQWERALKQASICATQQRELEAPARLLRGLIQTEHQRHQVFCAAQQPSPAVGMYPWMLQLAQALACNVRGDLPQADALRLQALQAAESQAPMQGEMTLECAPQSTQDGKDVSAEAAATATTEPQLKSDRIAWFSDTDSRLGPVCEVALAGAYRWLAFSDIEQIELQAPSSLIHLVWLPVRLTLQRAWREHLQLGDTALHAWLPTRYTLNPNEPHAAVPEDSLLMSRRTQWRDVGETGVFATGQKTWMSDAGDAPLLQLRRLLFDAHAVQPSDLMATADLSQWPKRLTNHEPDNTSEPHSSDDVE